MKFEGDNQLTSKQNPLLSIIVPCYNSAKTLGLFFSKILSSKSLQEYEIIIVNDGSTDQTLEIAEKYHKSYPQLVKVINQENGGHGAALNAGIAAASGIYCRPVDGDDWLDPKELDKAVPHMLECNDSDMIILDYQRMNLTNGMVSISHFEGLSRNPLINELNTKKIRIGYHSCIFRTSILKRIPAFDRHCFYVDNEYLAYPAPYIQTILYLHAAPYVHTIGEQDQSTSPQNLQRNETHIRRVILSLLRNLENVPISVEQREYVERIIVNLLSLYGIVCFNLPNQKGKRLYKNLCININSIYPKFSEKIHGSRLSLFNLFSLTNYRGYSFLRAFKMLQIKHRGGIIW